MTSLQPEQQLRNTANNRRRCVALVCSPLRLRNVLRSLKTVLIGPHYSCIGRRLFLLNKQ